MTFPLVSYTNATLDINYDMVNWFLFYIVIIIVVYFIILLHLKHRR